MSGCDFWFSTFQDEIIVLVRYAGERRFVWPQLWFVFLDKIIVLGRYAGERRFVWPQLWFVFLDKIIVLGRYAGERRDMSGRNFWFSLFRITALRSVILKRENYKILKQKSHQVKLVAFSYLKSCGESRIRTCEGLPADLQSALVGRLSISPANGGKYRNC
jgi:hypothetical protein